MPTTNLYLRVSALVMAAEARREARERERARVMVRIAQKATRFKRLAARVLPGLVRPRLELLMRIFSHAGPIERLRGGHGAALPFEYTEDFPAHARIEVSLAHDAACESVWCTFSSSILPILVEYERDVSLEVSLDTPDLPHLEEFLDERIRRFVESYLGLREPESIYQRSLRVHDPVCGMTFRRADAHSHLDRDGHRTFFCSDECRRRFEAAPGLHHDESLTGPALKSA
jgi:YHS domain-containing protein